MSNNIGLQVVEGVAAGFTTFTEPSKRNIALLMARERGVANKVIPIDSLDKDREIFGAAMSGSYGAIVTRNLFRNVGGYLPNVSGIRIVGAGSVAASGILTDDNGNVLNVKAGYLEEEDLGTWGNEITVTLYNKGSLLEGKWALNVFYKGVQVENYDSNTLADILKQVELSKFVTLTTSANITESGLTPQIDSGSVITSLANNESVTFSVAITGLANDAAAVGQVLYNSSGNKIGTIASYDGTALTGTLTDTPLIDISSGVAAFRQISSAFEVTLSGGVYNAPLEADFYGRDNVDGSSRGLNLLKGEDIQIFANTEFHTKSMAVEGNSFADQEDFLQVFVLPENATLATAQDYSNTLQSGTISRTSVYHGWVKTNIGGDSFGYVPMLGCVLGAGFVKATGLLGDFIHIPPAGQSSVFVDIVDMKPSKLSQQDIDRFVQDYTTNVVRFQTGLGYFLISSRTMSTNPLYHSIHIRLQTSFYKRVLYNNMGFVLQRPNTPTLRRDAYAAVFAYFQKEYNNGALENTVSFKQACEIIIDQRNNPVGQDRKLLNMDINWIPTEAVESFKISLNRNDGQLIINELNSN